MVLRPLACRPVALLWAGLAGAGERTLVVAITRRFADIVQEAINATDTERLLQ